MQALQAAVFDTGEVEPRIVQAPQFDIGANDTRSTGKAVQHRTPGIDDQGMAIGMSSPMMVAGLRGEVAF